QRHLAGARFTVAEAVGTGLVHIGVVMGVLDGGDDVAATGEFLHEADGKPGLAGILPSANAEDARCRHRPSSRIRRAFSRSCGVLTFMKGSSGSRDVAMTFQSTVTTR